MKVPAPAFWNARPTRNTCRTPELLLMSAQKVRPDLPFPCCSLPLLPKLKKPVAAAVPPVQGTVVLPDVHGPRHPTVWTGQRSCRPADLPSGGHGMPKRTVRSSCSARQDCRRGMGRSVSGRTAPVPLMPAACSDAMYRHADVHSAHVPNPFAMNYATSLPFSECGTPPDITAVSIRLRLSKKERITLFDRLPSRKFRFRETRSEPIRKRPSFLQIPCAVRHLHVRRDERGIPDLSGIRAVFRTYSISLHNPLKSYDLQYIERIRNLLRWYVSCILFSINSILWLLFLSPFVHIKRGIPFHLIWNNERRCKIYHFFVAFRTAEFLF